MSRVAQNEKYWFLKDYFIASGPHPTSKGRPIVYKATQNLRHKANVGGGGFGRGSLSLVILKITNTETTTLSALSLMDNDFQETIYCLQNKPFVKLYEISFIYGW